MKRTGSKLSALEINKLVKAGKPGRYCDGLGLFLQIGPSGSASWTFAYARDGRRHNLGLGPLHTITLAKARDRARELREQLLAGSALIGAKAAERAAAEARKIEESKRVTLEKAAREYIQVHESGWKNAKHCDQWRSSLATYAFPELGSRDVFTEIDRAAINACLAPIWSTKHETATRVRGRVERIVKWIKDGRPMPAQPKAERVKHHAALPYAELPAFAAELRSRDSASARALEFTILTAARTGEAIGATWSEIDLAKKVWTVPASRMKAKKEHRVPLSSRAVELLRSLPRHGEHVFGNGKPLSNMAMLELLRGLRPGYTVHGFRSAFMDWSHEQTAFPKTVIDMALAHTVGGVEGDYRRGDLLAKRAKLMQAWAGYLEPAAGENVTQLRRA